MTTLTTAIQKTLTENGATNVPAGEKKSIRSRLVNAANNVDKLAACMTLEDVMEAFPNSDPWQAFAVAIELRKLKEHAETKSVESFESTLVCHQDGTANGIQHTAAITRNRETAMAVNCTAADETTVQADIYGVIADDAATRLKGDALKAVEQLGREAGKPAVMVASYGASGDTIVKSVNKRVTDELGKAVPGGEDIGKEMAAGIREKTPAVLMLTDAIKSMAKKWNAESNFAPIKWKTHTGKEVTQQYTESTVSATMTNYAGASKTRESHAFKSHCGLSPNFVHSIDAAHLDCVVTKSDFQVVTVHDSFGCHAANFKKLNKTLREEYVEAHNYPYYAKLCESLNQTPLRKLVGKWDHTEALEARLMFS